jgi:hypothetical protein
MMTHPNDSEIYWVRPDVFIKSGDGKVYIRYQDRHYVLKMANSHIRTVLAFVDQLDGCTPIGIVLSHFAVEFRPMLLKFKKFLIDKGAAFAVVDGPSDATLTAVGETLTYLAEYSASPYTSYRLFAAQQIALVGAGYSLVSAIKTFARLGIQRLSVLHQTALGSHKFEDIELKRAFDSIKTRGDAELTLLSSENADSVLTPFDWVLHCQECNCAVSIGSQAPLLAARQMVGRFLGDILVIDVHSKAVDSAAAFDGRRGASNPPLLQAGGACFALVAFDVISNIKPWRDGRYAYYDLHGLDQLRFATHCQLRPIAEAQALPQLPGSAGKLADQIEAWDESPPGPLFPMQKPEELTASSSYLKVYGFQCAVAQDQYPKTVRLLTAGYDKASCIRQMLTTLATVAGLWFDTADAAEQASYAAAAVWYRQACGVVWEIPVADIERAYQHQNAAGALPEFTAGQEYIRFCIASSFACEPRWLDYDTNSAACPKCRIAIAGDSVVYLPYAGDFSAGDGEVLLFGLYAELRRRAHADSECLAVTVFLPTAAQSLAVATPAVRGADKWTAEPVNSNLATTVVADTAT